MSYDFLGDIDRIGMDAYKQGEEDAKKRAIEILASVLENWVHLKQQIWYIAVQNQALIHWNGNYNCVHHHWKT